MTVSVIIPCFNSARYIGQAIESVLNQSHGRCEIIVVDDGSTDESAAIISQFAGAITVIRQENAGACAARNAGLARASGDYVKFLDADDWLFPDCISNQLSHAPSANEVSIGYCRVVGEAGHPLGNRTGIDISTFEAGQTLGFEDVFNRSIMTSTPLHRTDTLRAFGGFDPSVQRGQEHDLHMRLYLGGVDFIFWPIECYAYRQHDDENRISNANRFDHYFSTLDGFEALVERAQTGKRSKDFARNKVILGRKAWFLGRRKFQLGEPANSTRFFSVARALAGREAIYGGRGYRMMASVLDPILVERLSLLGRRVLTGKKALSNPR